MVGIISQSKKGLGIGSDNASEGWRRRKGSKEGIDGWTFLTSFSITFVSIFPTKCRSIIVSFPNETTARKSLVWRFVRPNIQTHSPLAPLLLLMTIQSGAAKKAFSSPCLPRPPRDSCVSLTAPLETFNPLWRPRPHPSSSVDCEPITHTISVPFHSVSFCAVLLAPFRSMLFIPASFRTVSFHTVYPFRSVSSHSLPFRPVRRFIPFLFVLVVSLAWPFASSPRRSRCTMPTFLLVLYI